MLLNVGSSCFDFIRVAAMFHETTERTRLDFKEVANKGIIQTEILGAFFLLVTNLIEHWCNYTKVWEVDELSLAKQK